MATYTFIGHNLSINGSNVNVTTGATFSLVLTDDDPTIGDPGDTGEMVSVGGGTPETYTFLGIATTDAGETMAVIELSDGSLIGFNTNGAELANGNTKVTLADLVDDPVVPCLTPGTLILTPEGYVSIEDLEEGDLIITRDHGPRPVLKLLFRNVSAFEMKERLKPICLRKGALGADLPFADLIVSPQHRFAISDWRAQLLFGEDEVLVSAKSLCNDLSVRCLTDVEEVTYIHIVLDGHQIITANGVETETVLLSEDFLNSLPGHLRLEIETVFGAQELDELHLEHKAAAPILRQFEGSLLWEN